MQLGPGSGPWSPVREVMGYMSAGSMGPVISHEERLAIFESHGRTSTAYLSLSPDLEHVAIPGEGFVAYREKLGVRVVPGDPVSSHQGLHSLAQQMARGTTRGRQTVVFACDRTTRDAFEEVGFRSLHIGSEPVVDLGVFSLAGRRNRGLRGSVNRAKRRGLTLVEYIPAAGRDATSEEAVRRVSTEWCRTKGTPELNFLVGRLDFEQTYGKRYVLCLDGDSVVGYILLYPVPGTGDVYLDHMRRTSGSPTECLDYVLCETLEALRSEGVGRLFMGVCPFSELEEGSGDPAYVRPLFEMLRRPFGLVYPAEGEHIYKRKYATSWEPRYMCYGPRVSARGLLAVLDCLCRGGIPAILAHKASRLIPGRSGPAP